MEEIESSDSRSDSRLQQLSAYFSPKHCKRAVDDLALEEPRMLNSQELQEMFPGSLLAEALREREAGNSVGWRLG